MVERLGMITPFDWRTPYAQGVGYDGLVRPFHHFNSRSCLSCGLKQKTESALSEKLDVLRSDEAAVLTFLRDRLEKAR